MTQTFDMYVVEKTLDVKEKHGANQLLFDGQLRSVDDRKGGIDGAMMGSGAKLVSGKDRVQARIV